MAVRSVIKREEKKGPETRRKPCQLAGEEKVGVMRTTATVVGTGEKGVKSTISKSQRKRRKGGD